MKTKQTFIARLASYTFTVEKRDKEGKVVTRWNNGTRADEPVFETYRFDNGETRPSKGTFCVFHADEKTPSYVREALDLMAADPHDDVMTYEQYLKLTNPARHEAEAKAEKLEIELNAQKTENANLHKKLAEMQEMVEQATSPKRKG